MGNCKLKIENLKLEIQNRVVTALGGPPAPIRGFKFPIFNLQVFSPFLRFALQALRVRMRFNRTSALLNYSKRGACGVTQPPRALRSFATLR